MSRNADSLRAAFDQTTGTQSTSQVQGFPPGHFVGFYLSIDKGGALLVSPGEANVSGQGVILSATATVEENAWALPRVAQRMYYVYLKRDGNFYVDGIDPVFVPLFNGNYHPITNYRYLGKVFNSSDGKLIYKLSDHNDTGTDVIVGAKGFTGYMDYECDGVDDQTEINQAIQYVSESAVAITVILRGGSFYVSGTITGRSNCLVSSDGATIVDAGSTTMVSIAGSSTTILVERFELRGVIIDGNAASALPISAQYTKWLKITDVRIQNTAGSSDCVQVDESDVFWITRLVVVDPRAGACIRVSNSDYWIIQDCDISGECPGSGSVDLTGMTITFAVGGKVLSCNIHDIDCPDDFTGISGASTVTDCLFDGNIIRNVRAGLSSGSVCRGFNITGDQCVYSNNTIADISNYAATTFFEGINISGGSNVVKVNTVRNVATRMKWGHCEGSSTPPYLVGATDDTNTNCTVVGSSATAAYSGSYSHLFTKTSASATAARSYFHQWSSATVGQMGSLGAGLTYKLTGYVKVPSGGATADNCYLGFSSIASTSVTWTTGVVNTAFAATYDEWQGVSVSGTLHIDATAVMVYMGASVSVPQNSTFYVDHLRFAPIGVHNEHSQQYSNSGTGTQESQNSWQNPFPV